ncbi:acyltransferase family protein [Leekyejoonella antrihumi]|uniref:Acyltransferase family protein n=1 Tax=Leekyejoonella antrihumi TaxID=1660198 RepID=A0A563DT15_9MICO|nr:acyltransferase family protein [Leekyejoonella antrihumi]TWP33316.1 acyltransferase family protein [Leekyejoonella antrihumi]
MTTYANRPLTHRQASSRPVKKHRPALDGVRALAILLVMVFHGTNSLPQGGFYSVDVFFVLSGYLIAGLLLKEHRKWGSLDLTSFYIRRARRLLPALVAVVIGITLICPLVVDQTAMSTMRSDGLATLFYYANWHFISTDQSYFQAFGDPSPYRQMWTLAIEEQFYIVLPLTMRFLLRVTARNRRALPWILFALAAISALWMAHLFTPGQDPSRMYYGTDCRAQDLLLGSALAVWISMADRRRLTRDLRKVTAVGVAGALTMVAFFLFISDSNPFTYRGGFFVFVLATCAVIAVVELDQDGPVAKLFGYRPLAWVGKISYGLYLWHWPIFVMISPAHTSLSGIPLFVVRFAVSFALGTVSFYLLEEPIRRHGLKRWFGRTVGIISGYAVLPLTAILVLVATSSVQANPLINAKTGTTADTGNSDTQAKQRVLIVGDSVGFSVGLNFPGHDYPNTAMTGHTMLGCGTAVQYLAFNGKPQPGGANQECNDPFQNWSAYVKQTKAQAVVWSLGGWDVFDHVINGKVMKEQSPAYATYFRSRLEQGLKLLGPNVQVVIPNVPCYNQPQYVVGGENLAPSRNSPQRAAALNKILAGFASAHPHQVHIFNVAEHVCPGGKFTENLDGVKVRDDGVHYTTAGAKLFWKWIMPTLNQVTGEDAQNKASPAAVG